MKVAEESHDSVMRSWNIKKMGANHMTYRGKGIFKIAPPPPHKKDPTDGPLPGCAKPLSVG